MNIDGGQFNENDYFINSRVGRIQRPFRNSFSHIVDAAGILSPSEMREELGLYGDTSMDTLIDSYGKAALEQIEHYLNFPILSSRVKDYYVTKSNRYQLSYSHEQLNMTTIEVKVHRFNGADRTEDTIASSHYVLDQTDDLHLVVYVPDISDFDNLTDELVAPVHIDYLSSLSDDSDFNDLIRQAFRLVLGLYFEHRGTGNYPDSKKVNASLDLILAGRRRAYVGGV